MAAHAHRRAADDDSDNLSTLVYASGDDGDSDAQTTPRSMDGDGCARADEATPRTSFPVSGSSEISPAPSSNIASQPASQLVDGLAAVDGVAAARARVGGTPHHRVTAWPTGASLVQWSLVATVLYLLLNSSTAPGTRQRRLHLRGPVAETEEPLPQAALAASWVALAIIAAVVRQQQRAARAVATDDSSYFEIEPLLPLHGGASYFTHDEQQLAANGTGADAGDGAEDEPRHHDDASFFMGDEQQQPGPSGADTDAGDCVDDEPRHHDDSSFFMDDDQQQPAPTSTTDAGDCVEDEPSSSFFMHADDDYDDYDPSIFMGEEQPVVTSSSFFMHADDDDDPSIFMGEEQPVVTGPADVGHYVGALVDMLETADGSVIAQQAAAAAGASAADILVQKQLSDERAAAAAHASAMAMLVQQQITDEQAASAADAQAADILIQKQLSERQFASASVAHGLNLKVVSAIQEIHHTAKRDHADMENAASVAERDAKIAALTDELEFTRCEAKALSSDYLALDERRDGSMTSARLSQKLQPLLDCALQSGNLGQSDEIFLENFLTHIAKPNCPYHPLIADIAQHYSNLLGTTEYLTLARILKIPRSRSWIKEKRRDARQLIHVGTMYGQLDILSLSHDGNMFVAGGDATRVTAMAEAMVDPRRNINYLLGPCYDPDPRRHPSLSELPPIPENFDDLKKTIDDLYDSESIAVNVNLTALNCATDHTRPTTIIAAYPAARSGYTAVHQVLEWSMWRYLCVFLTLTSAVPRSADAIICLIGAATDSCGAELAAGLYAGIPNATELAAGFLLLGLADHDYFYFAKYYWERPFAWCV